VQISKDELIAVLVKFNPWWKNEKIPDVLPWHRAAFSELSHWVFSPPTHRAVLLSGARQVGKTTLLHQIIEKLLEQNVPVSNILYVTFDHPIIKLAGVEAVLEAWRELEPKGNGLEYLFLDEAQFISDWQVWVKHQVDFEKNHKIILTGSAMPLLDSDQESGVGRWHTIRLATLSFYEFLKLNRLASLEHSLCKNIMTSLYQNENTPDATIDFKKFYNLLKNSTPSELSKLFQIFSDRIHLNNNKMENSPIKLRTTTLPTLPKIKSLFDLFEWSPNQFQEAIESIRAYTGYFHDYLIRSGFPQITQIDSVYEAQRLLREDIIDKVLKRDMTALFGVRRVLDLEQIFLYLCMHDGGLLDMQDLTSNLAVKRPTVQRYLELLEAVHLIYRLHPYGYGKEVLRGKYKIYLADAAIASAVLLKGKSLLDDAAGLGAAVEAVVFKHIFTRYYEKNIRFSYWNNKEQNEVDLIAETDKGLIPFEVKYRANHINEKELKGLIFLCKEKSIKRGYVITKSPEHFGLLENSAQIQLIQIPATLLCYWMGENELSDFNNL
jgi:predicted AAA+ superfamily ATPase